MVQNIYMYDYNNETSTLFTTVFMVYNGTHVTFAKPIDVDEEFISWSPSFHSTYTNINGCIYNLYKLLIMPIEIEGVFVANTMNILPTEIIHGRTGCGHPIDPVAIAMFRERPTFYTTKHARTSPPDIAYISEKNINDDGLCLKKQCFKKYYGLELSSVYIPGFKRVALFEGNSLIITYDDGDEIPDTEYIVGNEIKTIYFPNEDMIYAHKYNQCTIIE